MFVKRGLFFVVLVLVLLSGCQKAVKVTTNGALSINSKELPLWEAPGAATFTLDVSGGVSPYNFAVGGSLPEGFNLGPDGTIGGMARLAPGSSSSVSAPFTIIVTDSAGNVVSQSFTIRLVEVNTVQLFTPPGVCVNGQYCDTIIATATGGNPPYSFMSDTFREGAPPMGMIVDVNGHLVGTPKIAGLFTFGVCVKDTLGYQRCSHSTVDVEKGIILEGTWVGSYGETETSSYCINSNSGTLTLSLTEKDGSFSGTVDDSGVSSASDATGGASCEGGSFHMTGTVSGTIVGDIVSGTMRLSASDMSYVLPFTATITTKVMTGSYSGTGKFDGGSSKISAGSFRLNKKS